MKRARGISGFSLVEVVLIIVIIGFGFSGLSVVLSSTTVGNIELDQGITAVFLAREKMSEVKAQNFGDVTDVSTTSFGGGYSAYNYAVAVDYVDPANLDTPVVGPTDYKRIVVTVTGNVWGGNIELTNLKTDVES
jgi:type II secretory pathway pseudopilin PulG